MALDKIEFPTEDFEKKLEKVLENSPSKISKLSIRSIILDVLDKKGIYLSKDDQINFYIGDETDELNNKLNQIMVQKGYSPLSTHDYIKLHSEVL